MKTLSRGVYVDKIEMLGGAEKPNGRRGGGYLSIWAVKVVFLGLGLQEVNPPSSLGEKTAEEARGEGGLKPAFIIPPL